jgi:hypothetical protein
VFLNAHIFFEGMINVKVSGSSRIKLLNSHNSELAALIISPDLANACLFSPDFKD